MTDREAAVHAANEAKYGPLPEPVRFRKGPINDEGQPLDPERRIIAVYPDGTFPILKHSFSEQPPNAPAPSQAP